jgi:K+-sensing histidine kinase KdpD
MHAEPSSPIAVAPAAGNRPASRPPRGSPVEYFGVAGVIAGLTGLGFLLPGKDYQSVGLIYLLAIIILSLRVGRGPVVLAGVLSALTWDFCFIPPRFQIRISNPQDTLFFLTYFVVALVAGQFTARVRAQTIEREYLNAVRERERLLAESEKLHRALLDSVSHELRTPLAVITAALEELDDVPPPERAGLVGEIRTAARRLNRLVGNLLDQTRLEGGALKPRLDWCDARDLINEAVAGASDAILAHPLEIHVPEDMPPVRADFALTEQALANLVLNAALYTPAAAPITIAAGLAGDGSRAFFSVADRGPGVPPILREHLFDKFVRAHPGRTGGLGLGLSIVRGFIAAQGGTVAVDDNPGGGAVFAIYLPHAAPQTPPPE